MATIDVRDLGTLNLFRARTALKSSLKSFVALRCWMISDAVTGRSLGLTRSRERVKSARAGGRRVGAAKKSYATGSSSEEDEATDGW